MNDEGPGLRTVSMMHGRKGLGGGEREVRFTTVSGEPIARSIPGGCRRINFLADVGFPGEYPYTRGIHHTMYRGRLWTCASSPASAPRGHERRYHYSSATGRPGCPSRLISDIDGTRL